MEYLIKLNLLAKIAQVHLEAISNSDASAEVKAEAMLELVKEIKGEADEIMAEYSVAK